MLLIMETHTPQISLQSSLIWDQCSLLYSSLVNENPAKFVWSMERTSSVSVGVSCAGWKVKSSSKLLASFEDFCGQVQENAWWTAV